MIPLSICDKSCNYELEETYFRINFTSSKKSEGSFQIITNFYGKFIFFRLKRLGNKKEEIIGDIFHDAFIEDVKCSRKISLPQIFPNLSRKFIGNDNSVLFIEVYTVGKSFVPHLDAKYSCEICPIDT